METEIKPTRVLEIGAEGFLLQVLGEEHGGRWRFRSTHDSRTFAEFDPDLAGDTVYAASGWMDQWEDVLALLDRKQYWRLCPILVHPRFANAIRMAVASRKSARAQTTRWEDAISEGHRELPGRSRARPPEKLTVDVSCCQSPEQRVVLDRAAFPTLQSLLDRLFSMHLHRVAPAHSYGTQWILINDRNMLRVTKTSDRDNRSLTEADVRANDRLTVELL